MPTIKTILSEERCNRHTIRLHKEGIFYVAYEQSCYAFSHYIKSFKLKKKHIKLAEMDVVKLGFPLSSLTTMLSERQWECIDEKKITAKMTMLRSQLNNYTPYQVRDSLNSFLGLMKRYKTMYIRKKIIRPFLKWDEYGLFNHDFSIFFPYKRVFYDPPHSLLIFR